jgi:Domain of unknown function (DUF6438)
MLGIVRAIVVLACLLSSVLWASDEKPPAHPSFDYAAALTHEIKPHRRTIPLSGVQPGFNQLHLKLIVSSTGDVVDAQASDPFGGDKLWPQVRDEVFHWKFTPFKENGKAVTAEVEEYVDLVPPERLPKNHVAAPAVLPTSKVAITLRRSYCYGTCPSYTVTVSTEGIVFDGGGFVIAEGKHTDTVDPDEVRKLAKKFVAADFYSMDDNYASSVTDMPTYALSISIDGRSKNVEDYVGEWQGMPAVISELEREVDAFAGTDRWIKGSEGLMDALKAERYNFQTFEAQVMLKEAASWGNSSTARDLLEAGVPLVPIPAPKPSDPHMHVPFAEVGWLTAAAAHPEMVQLFINAGASKNDQNDKDLALAAAAPLGKVESARALIAYLGRPECRSQQTDCHTRPRYGVPGEGYRERIDLRRSVEESRDGARDPGLPSQTGNTRP